MKNASLVILLIVIFLLILLLILFPFISGASPLGNSLQGTVTNTEGSPLYGVIVSVASLKIGTITDSNGHYEFLNLPTGIYRVRFVALNYLTLDTSIAIIGAVVKNFTLEDRSLSEVVFKGTRLSGITTISHTEISGTDLLTTRGSSLGESLKSLPGLNSVQTGPTLSKPMIHGLHSDRVLVINDGVRQEGQQWGSEHAPEIDPFIAEKIAVVKGASSVQYGSDAIAGAVLFSPEALPENKGISGATYMNYSTNGKAYAISSSLQGALGEKLDGLSWRVQGTLKDAGNFQTPRYFLTNTGAREGDGSVNIGYRRKWFCFNTFYSVYDTKVGVFFGAESGNLNELLAKYNSSTPGIPSYFSRTIARPYQTVLHQLLKSSATINTSGGGKLDITFGRQNDVRQEYDELGAATAAAQNSPQLKFQLVTHSLDLIYTEPGKRGFTGSFGLTGLTSGNVFEGVRSLIPNYRDYNAGAFAIQRFVAGKFVFEAGARYDYRWLRVYERNQTTLNIYNETYQYLNLSGTAGCSYRLNDRLSASLNSGTGWRAPSINEMYIYGEHFSDASFQVGDSTLKSERSLNTGLSVKYTSARLRVNVEVYYNRIRNFIYDKPALRIRTLPSGAFPEFDFTQANVRLCGMESDIQYDVSKQVTLFSKPTIVRGYNETISNWLINMPSDRFENGVEYHLGKIGKLISPYIMVEQVFVSKQVHVPPNSDYVPAPSAYNLLNANAGFTFSFKSETIDVNLSANNLTNVAYRDYLDHFRYYADELGANYTLHLKFTF